MMPQLLRLLLAPGHVPLLPQAWVPVMMLQLPELAQTLTSSAGQKERHQEQFVSRDLRLRPQQVELQLPRPAPPASTRLQ